MGSESVNAYSLKFTRYRAIVIVQLLSQVQLFAAPLLQHARLPCLSLFPGVCSNSYQLSWWCHPIISSSVVLLLLPPSIFPIIRVLSNECALHIRWPSTGASTSASVLPKNIEDWSHLGSTGLISLLLERLSRVFSNNTV